METDERPNAGPSADYASLSRNDHWKETWTENQNLYNVEDFSEAFSYVFDSNYVLTDGGEDKEYTDGLVGASAEYEKGTVKSEREDIRDLMTDGGDDVESELEDRDHAEEAREALEDPKSRYSKYVAARDPLMPEFNSDSELDDHYDSGQERDANVKRVRYDE